MHVLLPVPATNSRRIAQTNALSRSNMLFCCLQGYTKLLSVLGSNVAEFLQNLNNLHLHLSYCWPDMVPPAFRCEQVGPSSNACI
jgi:guanylate cyclase soluble subunit beta